MRLLFSLTTLLTITSLLVVLSSCTRHAPPEDIIRKLCEGDMRKTIFAANTVAEEPIVRKAEIKVMEITRKGIGESKNTRGIPDKTLVYPIACQLQATIDGIEFEPETLFLYFFRNNEGDWLVRRRKLETD